FTQTLVANQDPPIPIADTWDWSNTKHTADTNLQYVFFSDLDFSRANPIGRLSLAIDGGTDLNNRLSLASNVLDPNGNPQFNQQSPFILLDFDQLPDPNKVFKKDTKTIFGNDSQGAGSVFKDATHFELLQAGFSQTQIKENNTDIIVPFVTRAADNFLLLEVRPGKLVDGEPVLDTDSTA